MVLPVMAATVDEHVGGGDSLKGGHALFCARDTQAQVRRLSFVVHG